MSFAVMQDMYEIAGSFENFNKDDLVIVHELVHGDLNGLALNLLYIVENYNKKENLVNLKNIENPYPGYPGFWFRYATPIEVAQWRIKNKK